MREIKLIVIHCSASQNGKPLGVQDIDREHAKRGFKRSAEFMKRQNPDLSAIGYHFVIYTNGAVATGRHLDEIGAHVRGYNQKSIGICMIGGLDADGKVHGKFTGEQWLSLSGLVFGLRKDYPAATILGHRDLSPDLNGDGKIEPNEYMKECPTFTVSDWLDGGMKALDDHLFTSTACAVPETE